MKRCIDLALLAGIEVKTNPRVGALLVYKDQIIGEGYHSQYGKSHAEIHAIQNVIQADQYKIPDSTLYVTLEPCSHFGKTPPCTHKIIDEGIKSVVIGCKDPNPMVSGDGINYLKKHGVTVIESELKKECEDLISIFKTNLKKRPFIILKWAQSADNFISKVNEQVWLSNEFSRVLTHKWRTECDGIMIGKKTAITDYPALNARLYRGANPIRIIMDSHLQASKYYENTESSSKAFVINQKRSSTKNSIIFLKVRNTKDLSETLSILFANEISVLMVEGGADLINSFINADMWDEARIIKTRLKLINGVAAPTLTGKLKNKIKLADDEVLFLENDPICIRKKR